MPSSFHAIQLSLFLGAVALTSGCEGASHAVSTGAQLHELAQLELTYTRELQPAAPTRLEAAAHFVRYRTADASSDAALDEAAVAGLLGITRGSDDAIAIDSCKLDEGNAPTAPAALEVSLLDAGPITLRRAGSTRSLVVVQPQHYPELLPFVSGVMYALESTQELAPAASIEIEADGGEDVGPFVASAKLPSAFPELVIAPGPELDVRWKQGPSGAPVIIDLRWGGAAPGAVRCKAFDDGRFVVPHAWVAAGLDPALAAGNTAQLSVQRGERSALIVPAIGRGQLLVTLRDVVTLVPAAQQ